ncbi:flagellar basal-body rod protein FlgF [Sporosarcina sp. P37]|uniref:flagellar basal body rod protein FlgG n=1 Tax=unclassified Sporosarcina TaxID=2647733 RepID=UPI0009BCC0A5|nr:MULTISPECIES: flagellar basal body rod protein FlgG [unclassified Sporosarcina]ARD49301.1 flagellar basal-body rod protein FlgG [Sporosarcina sp. P33]ARK25774.1 flagellar basal-body rod protein FlgF [Sporosarcina sp. P37]PID19202.1 flagellar basal-body rod protein FlgF [Sporosarcina sp. P35]
MIRSMYSGISGLKNFQTKLDVIGNNIANVNTYGFKKGRTVFKDLYSQTVAGASEPGANRGGVNPKQVGLGSQLATIDTIHSGGSMQTTGNTLDLAIEGDGFFIVGQDGGSEKFYTRAGNFYLDKEGDIVDGDGRYLLDEAGTKIYVPLTSTSLSIGQDGAVNVVNEDGELEKLANVGLATFNNPGGLSKVGGNLYEVSANSGEPSEGLAIEEGRGAIKSGSLEMSNVDLSEEFTEMIVAQRGFQANTRIITTSDEILQELVNLKR